jgi:hypothetical protein
MPSVHLLHERTFGGKPFQSLKVYNDPFGDTDVCLELSFVDGQIACLCIGPGRPQIVSSDLCYEPKLDSCRSVEPETDRQRSVVCAHMWPTWNCLARVFHPKRGRGELHVRRRLIGTSMSRPIALVDSLTMDRTHFSIMGFPKPHRFC